MKQEQRKREQYAALEEVSREIWGHSRHFDIDASTNQKESQFDRMVSENVVQKCLEDDCLLFVEGIRNKNNPDFLEIDEIEQNDSENEDGNISACDFNREFDQKNKEIEEREHPRVGKFEQSSYFRRLFPSLKIQKPGYDLYGWTTFFTGFAAYYVFMFYGEFSVDQANYLKDGRQNISIFKGDMVMCLMIIITIIVIERYANRSDTKPVKLHGLQDEKSQQNFFSESEMFKRSSTNRSMTIKLKTLRTSDLDVQDDSAQNFLRSLYGDESKNNSFDSTRTKITQQQKCKYMMHITIMVVAHIFIFWFIPIHGNLKLYGRSTCDVKQQEYYGCKNFHLNPFLIGFYIIVCIYLFLSALQIRYGFPIYKKPSSVLQYVDSDLGMVGSQIFNAIPFLVEIRALLDFTFSKTSLDVFQFWQLWQYHFDFYNAKESNRYYRFKIVGSPTGCLDKCIFGWLISTVMLTLLVGPLYFFSDIGGFT